jgi:hypothetical protein
VQDTLITDYTTTSATFNDTGLTVDITPSSASSRILILSNARFNVARTGAVTGNYGAAQLLRDATALQEPFLGIGVMASTSDPEIYLQLNHMIVDSPATTSLVTYKIQAKRSLANQTIGIAASATNIASIIAIEIGA